MGQKTVSITNSPLRFLTYIIVIFGFLTLPVQADEHQEPGPLTQLTALNEQWPTVFANKDIKRLPDFYSPDALMAQYPYNEADNLEGLEAITAMFSNGPFKLVDASVKTWTLRMDARGNGGLILKKWQLNHSEGSFSGLAIKVASQQDNQWHWDIELSGGGLKSLSDFAKNDFEPDNSAFGYIATRLLNSKKPNHEEHLIDMDVSAAVQTASEGLAEFNNVLAIENDDTGLLITRASKQGYNYIVFMGLARVDGHWKVVTRVTKFLPGNSEYRPN